MYRTSKLSWNKHIDSVLAKARKSLNFLKIVMKQKWGQDTKTLLHLATSLVRSKLTYGQEIYFSAPKCHLKKLRSVDSKAIKLVLGVPTHASTIKSYKEALDEC